MSVPIRIGRSIIEDFRITSRKNRQDATTRCNARRQMDRVSMISKILAAWLQPLSF